MKTINVIRARFIIPFMIKDEAGYSELVHRLCDTESNWYPSQEGANPPFEKDLLESVQALISDKDDTVYNTGRHFRLKAANDAEILSALYNSPKGEELPFKISDCGLFVFKSGTCFVWYEVGFENVSSDLFISFVNEFKELSYPRLARPDKNRQGKIPFCINGAGLQMGDYLKDRILSDMAEYIEFFAKRESPTNGSDIPDKSIAFIYSVYDQPGYEEDMYLYTNGFNSKYKVPSNIDELSYKPFDNVTCYMTANGCSYTASFDESNQNFFTKTMKNKVMGDYFYMFILVLHQYYGIMNFNIRINSTLPAEFEKDRDLASPESLLDTLNDITMDINFFMSKNFFPSVSHIFHQNEFYYYLQKRLNITQNLEYLTIGLDAMRQMDSAFIARKNDEKEKEAALKEEKSKERLEIAFSALSVLTIFSAVADGDATVDIIAGLIFHESSMPLARILLLCGLGGILLIVLVALLKTIIKYFKGE